MRWVLRAAGLFAAVWAVLSGPQPALAHPLGNFTVNRYSRIEFAGDVVKLRYVLDMAEIPTFAERLGMDTDRDGQISAAERSAFVERQASELRPQLRLVISGQTVSWRLIDSAMEFLPGLGDLPTLRMRLDFAAYAPQGAGLEADYADGTFEGKLGWSEVVVSARNGAELERSSVPDHDISKELTAYPDDMILSPVTVREARFTVSPGTSPGSFALPEPIRPVVAGAQDALTALATAPVLDPLIVIGALLAAAALGAAHALSPGHGKAVVAAYLVGSKGTARHAGILGLTVTVTHTLGVFALGLATLSLSQFILPERIFPWLELASGLLIVALGVGLFGTRLRGALAQQRRAARFATASHSHDTAVAGDHASGHHDHAHEHDHSHDAAHAAGHVHEHGGSAHTHAPPEAVSLRSLLALGISGGLLPCPSALVVLLSAIALGRVAFGLVLVTFFSFGLAAVLTGLGLAMVYARRIFERLPAGGVPGAVLRFAPVVSALVIAAAGVAVTWSAVAQARLLLA